jgi:hypothetical protein
MLSSSTELINIEASVDYSPTFVSTDKRAPLGSQTTIGYWQIGANEQNGHTHGPIYRVEFIDVAAAVSDGAAFIAIWGIDNRSTPAVYPISHFYDSANSINLPKTIDVFLQKFEFWDSGSIDISDTVDPLDVSIIGHKRRTFPIGL